jgi:hypothetical protein
MMSHVLKYENARKNGTPEHLILPISLHLKKSFYAILAYQIGT